MPYIGIKIQVGRGNVNINITTEPPPMNETNLRDSGLSAADINARLSYHAFTLATTGKTLDIRGNEKRTSESNPAYTELTEVLDNLVVEDNS